MSTQAVQEPLLAPRSFTTQLKPALNQLNISFDPKDPSSQKVAKAFFRALFTTPFLWITSYFGRFYNGGLIALKSGAWACTFTPIPWINSGNSIQLAKDIQGHMAYLAQDWFAGSLVVVLSLANAVVPEHLQRAFERVTHYIRATFIQTDPEFVKIGEEFIKIDGETVQIEGKIVKRNGNPVKIDGKFIQIDGKFIEVDGKAPRFEPQSALQAFYRVGQAFDLEKPLNDRAENLVQKISRFSWGYFLLPSFLFLGAFYNVSLGVSRLVMSALSERLADRSIIGISSRDFINQAKLFIAPTVMAIILYKFFMISQLALFAASAAYAIAPDKMKLITAFGENKVDNLTKALTRVENPEESSEKPPAAVIEEPPKPEKTPEQPKKPSRLIHIPLFGRWFAGV